MLGNLFNFGTKNNATTNGNVAIAYDPTQGREIQSVITNVSGFDQLDIQLSGQGAIYTRAECQLIMDKSLSVFATIGGKGIAKALYRSFASGTFFLNRITPIDNGSGKLSIFSFIPGNIQKLDINIGEEWCIHHSAFLACTENITIETGVSFATTLTGNGTFYTKIKNVSQKLGTVWLVAYGGIAERKLNENKNFIVHSGLFLAVRRPVYDKLKIGLASTIFSSIAGGQGIVMDFSQTEPSNADVLYLQTGNLDEFLSFISNAVMNKEMHADMAESVVSGVIDGVAAANKGGKRHTRKIHKRIPK